MKKKPSKWTLTYGGIAVVVGTTLGQSINGEISVAGLLGSLTVATILFVINIIKNRSKTDNTPEFDERTTHNMVRFYAFSSNIFIGLLFILFSVFTFIGMESIPVSYIWVLLLLYFALSGITSFIISRR